MILIFFFQTMHVQYKHLLHCITKLQQAWQLSLLVLDTGDNKSIHCISLLGVCLLYYNIQEDKQISW